MGSSSALICCFSSAVCLYHDVKRSCTVFNPSACTIARPPYTKGAKMHTRYMWNGDLTLKQRPRSAYLRSRSLFCSRQEAHSDGCRLPSKP